jgi:hypothetical protein
MFNHLDKIFSSTEFDRSLLGPQEPGTEICSQTLESIANPCFVVFVLLILRNLTSSYHQHHIYIKYCNNPFPCQIYISSTFSSSVALP